MSINFLTVLITVFALVLMMVPGFVFGKLKLLPAKGAETCSNIVMYCCQTAMMLDVFLTKTYTKEIGKNMLYTFVLTLAVHLIMYALVTIIFRQKSDRARIVKYASFFSNCGFMGIPFLKMLFEGHPSGDSVLICTAMVLTVFNILNWTLGTLIISGDRKAVSVKKIVLNPVIISIVIGFVLFITIKKPIEMAIPAGALRDIMAKIMVVVKAFSDMVTPLSMFVIGLKLANINLKQLFLDWQAYIVSGIKLLVMPLVSILLVAFLPIDVVVKYTVFLCLAMPTATSGALFAVMYDKESDFATVCVLLSTILSVVSLPVMFLVMSGLFNVVI